MRKKMLSWILTLTMVLSLFTALPITANAQTGVCEIIDTDGVTFVKDCDTLDEALTDVANGQTLRLLTDVPYAETLYAIGKSFSIDVNGFNLTVNPVNKNCVLVGDTQDLNIYDSRTGGSLTVTASGGDNLAGLYATGTDSAISIAVPSTITVNSDNGIGVRADDLDRIDLTSATTITATGSQSRGVYTTYGGSVNILNAIITADTYCVEAYGKKDDTPSSITVVGNVTASGMYANGAYVWGGADISITGDVSATNSGYGVWVEDGNAAITGDVTAGIYAAYATGGNSTITITGDVAATDADGAGADANNGGTITVNGNASGGRYGAFALYGGTILVTGDATAAGGLSPEYSAAVIADGDGSSVSVGGNATLTGSNGYGVQANNGGIVTVGGNVSATRSGCYGAYAIGYDYGGEITIEGSIDATTYISVGGDTKEPGENNELTTKEGYLATYTFPSVRANHTIEAQFAHDCPSKPFTDVDITQWYHEGIDYVLLAGLFKGTSSTTFEPDSAMTRAMLVTVLHRLEGNPATTSGNPFTDIASGNWYSDAVVWANAKGIVKGYDSDTFGTNDFITREQLAAILYRYAQYKGYDVSVGEDTNILSYEDALNISEYAIPAVQWACGAGIMQGDGAKIDPQGNATRAQVAVMLMRFIENVVK